MKIVLSTRVPTPLVDRIKHTLRCLHLANPGLWDQTHLVLLHKPTPSHGYKTWWMTDYDGYNNRRYSDLHFGHLVFRLTCIIWDT
jgi:hypothetical protein